MVDQIELRRPDDWHLHLRDGDALASALPHTTAVFGRAIVMPNLVPPVATVEAAAAYRSRILEARPDGAQFEPLMTLYLTPGTSPRDIEAAAAADFVHAVKLYPAGATTNAEAGVSDLGAMDEVLAAMAEHDLALCVHGESIDPEHDPFDREARFVGDTLAPLVSRHPALRVVLEHITTAEGVRFVQQATGRVAGTVTPQHLLYDRRALFAGGLRPHLYCLPLLKRSEHRDAIVEAVTAGDGKFFAGTDSAPHERGKKESACGCAGVFNAPVALGLYAEAFDEAGALERLETFASLAGPRFYGLPPHETRITLVREPWRVPQWYPFAGGAIVPLRAGETVAWRIRSRSA